jgi:hypothetical protein
VPSASVIAAGVRPDEAPFENTAEDRLMVAEAICSGSRHPNCDTPTATTTSVKHNRCLPL